MQPSITSNLPATFTSIPSPDHMFMHIFDECWVSNNVKNINLSKGESQRNQMMEELSFHDALKLLRMLVVLRVDPDEFSVQVCDYKKILQVTFLT